MSLMRAILSLSFFIITLQARDVCNPNVVLKELEVFKLEQRVVKDIPLDFGPYIDLFNSLNKHKDQFQEIASNYTRAETYTVEEPDPLIPYTLNDNLIRIEVKSSDFDLECRKKGAIMIDLSPSTNKNALIKAMKLSKLDKTPIKLFNFHGRALNFDGTPVGETPTTYIGANLAKNWVSLLQDGSIQYPTVAEDTSVVPGFCQRRSNFWDSGTPNKNLFMGLMRKMVQEFPLFNKNLGQIIKLFKTKTRNSTDSIQLTLPPPLITLDFLFKKFHSIRNWHDSTSSDFSNFVDLLSLLKKSRHYFKNLVANNYVAEPSSLIEKLGVDNSKFEGTNHLHVSSSKGDLSTISTDIIDKSDIYTLYKIVPVIHHGTVPPVHFMIKNNLKVFLFITRPSLTQCVKDADEIQICKSWEGDIVHSECLKYITGKSSSNNEVCPLAKVSSLLTSIRTDCQSPNGVLLSSYKSKAFIRIYCDDIYQAQFAMANTLKSLDTQCEIREVVDNVERVIEPQIVSDLIDERIVSTDNLLDSNLVIEDNLLTILLYSIPSAVGFAILVSFLICGTIFCIFPQKLRDLCKCCHKTQTQQDIPSNQISLRASPYPSQLDPLTGSRPQSRAVSPARLDAPRLDFSHSYRT